MIYDDIVSLVCSKVGQTDADSVAICGQFLTSRAETIWDSQPWRDSLMTCAVQLPNLPGWPSCPFLLMPLGMGRVIKVRFDPRSTLDSWETAMTFDIGADAFDQVGVPVSFSQLAPVVAQIAGTGSGTTGQNDTVQINTTVQADNGMTFDITMELADGTIAVSTGNTFFDTTNPPTNGTFILSFNKAVTQGQIQFLSNAGTATLISPYLSSTSGYLPASSTFVPTCQRIRLQPAPTGAGSVLVHGKRAFPGFASGQQYALPNLDNALQDFCQSDMLERDRQYAKAQAKIQSANSLVQIAISVETKQAANTRRAIPFETGFETGAYGFGWGNEKSFW